MDALRRLDLRWPALAGGIAYVVAVTLIGTQADTDPVGSHYAASTVSSRSRSSS